MPKDKPKPDIIKQFKACQDVADKLNASSDALGAAVNALAERIHGLHLGVAAWHLMAVTAKKERHIGYTKINGKWDLAIREVELRPPDDNDEYVWRFNEAPLWMRLEAISHLPDFMTTLVKRADEMREKTEAATARALELLAGLDPKV